MKIIDFIVETIVLYALVALFAAFLFWGGVIVLIALSGGKLP